MQTAQANQARLIELGHGIEPPPGTMSTKPYSVFMDVYAAFCRDHMRRHGTTQRQIAAVAAKNHTHSVHNPLSQYRQAYTVEEVLAAPPIAYPLTLPMCAPVSDGAAAALLCTDAGLQRLAGDARRAVRVPHPPRQGARFARARRNPLPHCGLNRREDCRWGRSQRAR